MGKVNVKFFGGIIQADKRQTLTEIDAPTMRQLFERLSGTLGDSFTQRVVDHMGNPQAFVNVFVNDKDIRHLNGLETRLNDGDEVLILPAIAGG